MIALHWHAIAATIGGAIVDAWIWACLLATGAGILRWGFGRRR